MIPTVKIEVYYDTVSLILGDGAEYNYSNEDEDLGASAIASLLKSLGVRVEVEEIY